MNLIGINMFKRHIDENSKKSQKNAQKVDQKRKFECLTFSQAGRAPLMTLAPYFNKSCA